MTKTIKDKCTNWFIARIQRREERERDLGDTGTKGFERAGCFECKGYDEKCLSYYPSGKLAEELYYKVNRGKFGK